MLKQSVTLGFVTSFALLAGCHKPAPPKLLVPGDVLDVLHQAYERSAEEACLVSAVGQQGVQIFYGDSGVGHVALNGEMVGTIILPDVGADSDQVVRYVSRNFPYPQLAQNVTDCSKSISRLISGVGVLPETLVLSQNRILSQNYSIETVTVPIPAGTVNLSANEAFEMKCIAAVSREDNLQLAFANNSRTRYNVILDHEKIGELWRWQNKDTWVRIDGAKSFPGIADVNRDASMYENELISDAARLCGQLAHANDMKKYPNIVIPLPPAPYYRSASAATANP